MERDDLELSVTAKQRYWLAKWRNSNLISWAEGLGTLGSRLRHRGENIEHHISKLTFDID